MFSYHKTKFTNTYKWFYDLWFSCPDPVLPWSNVILRVENVFNILVHSNFELLPGFTYIVPVQSDFQSVKLPCWTIIIST